MSNRINYSNVSKRRSLHPNNSTEFNKSGDKYDENYAFEEEHDSSKSESMSDEPSSQSLLDQESPRSRKDLSDNRTLQTSPLRNKSRYYNYREESYHVDKKSDSKSGGTAMLFLLIPVIILIAIWIFSSKSVECSFETLRQKYTDQDSKMWHILSSGVNNILKDGTENPGVYLFLHNDTSKMDSIVREIATQTSNCFGGQSQFIEMSENDFTSPRAMEDYGYAVLKFKEKIKNGRVALIVNLNSIPAESARALHTICDTYTPVAKNIVIYLTLVIPTINGNKLNIARDTLNSLWALKLQYNELDPLITRVTDQIITLY